MTSIVCDTDFSPRSQRAGQVAALLAARLSARLHLVHVITSLGAELMLSGDEHAWFAPEQTLLRREASELRRLGASVKEHLVAGAHGACLAAMLVAGQHEILVLAHRPEDFWERLLGGEVASVVASVAAPVLVVRDSEPLLAWLRHEHRLRVVVGIDASSATNGALRWARELGRAGSLEALVACFSGRSAATTGPSASVDESATAHPYRARQRPEDARLGQDVLDAALRALMCDPAVAGGRIEHMGGAPWPALLELARAESAELIVVDRALSRRRVRSVPVWRALVRSDLPCTTACVPATYAPADGLDLEASTPLARHERRPRTWARPVGSRRRWHRAGRPDRAPGG